MTNKELQKLGRRELLQLLLEQAKEADRLSKLLKETDKELKELEEGYERLRERLDQKDAQIRELKDTIQTERDKKEADLAEVGSIAEAALKLNGVFDAAQQAAEQYLQSVRAMYPLPPGVEPPPMPDLSQLQAQAWARTQAQQPRGWAQPQQQSWTPGQPWAQPQAQAWTQPQPQPQAQTWASTPPPGSDPYQFPYGEPVAGEYTGEEDYRAPRQGSRSRTPFGGKKDGGRGNLFFGWQRR